MRTRMMYVAGAAAVALATVAGLASAGALGIATGGTISACYQVANGNLRAVAHCPTGTLEPGEGGLFDDGLGDASIRHAASSPSRLSIAAGFGIDTPPSGASHTARTCWAN